MIPILTPEVWEKTVNMLLNYGEVSKSELFRLTGYGNKNKFFEYVKEWEEEKLVKTRQLGNKIMVRLYSPISTVDTFINNFNKRLDNYQKLINKQLQALENSRPLVPSGGNALIVTMDDSSNPMKKIPTREPVLELDKKKQAWVYKGKTRAGYAYTWKTRTKPRRHLEQLLLLLDRIYKEQTALTFAVPLTGNPTLIEGYQKHSNKMIEDTIKKIENMFKDDIPSLSFISFQIRHVMYGMILKHQMEKEVNPKKLFA